MTWTIVWDRRQAVSSLRKTIIRDQLPTILHYVIRIASLIQKELAERRKGFSLRVWLPWDPRLDEAFSIDIYHDAVYYFDIRSESTQTQLGSLLFTAIPSGSRFAENDRDP